MILADIQRSKLKKLLEVEALRRGVTLNPFDISEFFSNFYTTSGTTPGFPTVSPVVQEGRTPFNVTAYNSFIQSAELDLDVINSFFRRTRIDGRNILLYNDTELRRMIQVLKSIQADIASFHKTTNSINDSNYKLAHKNVDLGSVKYVTVAGTNPLYVDPSSSNISLEPVPSQSYDVDMSFLANLTDAVSVSTKSGTVLSVNEPASLANLVADDPTPWTYIVDTSSTAEFATMHMVLPLNALTEINYITVKPIAGVIYHMVVATSSANSGWTTTYTVDKLEDKDTSYFSPRTVDSVRLTITVPKIQGSDTSSFLFGLTAIQFGLTAFHAEGSLVMKGIEPNISGRPILEVTMQTGIDLPVGTSIEYFIGLNTPVSAPDLQIKGDKTEEGTVTFSVVSELDKPRTEVSRTSTFELYRNSINFSSVQFAGLTPLNINANTYIPHLSEVWLGQNVLSSNEYPDFEVRNIQDAIVDFSATNTKVNVRVPLSLAGLPLHHDSVGDYLKLPLPMSFVSIATVAGGVLTITDVNSLMKTEDYGVFKVTKYSSSSPDKPTVINADVVTSDMTSTKVYLSGTYEQNTLFTIDYLGDMDSTVEITRGSLKLHEFTGNKGAEQDNQIPLSSGKYQVDYVTGKLFTSDPSMLGKKYLDFRGLFDSTKLNVYEAWVNFTVTKESIEIDRKIEVDSEAGEFISFRHLSTGTNVSVSNVDRLVNVLEGEYLLTIVSKPLSTQPSAIKSMLSVREVSPIVDVKGARVFSASEDNYIDRLGLTNKPYKYVARELLFNDSVPLNNFRYSSVVVDDILTFVAPTISAGVLYVNDVDDEGELSTGEEYGSIKLTSFASNLFKDDVHSKVNVRMVMKNDTTGAVKKLTPLLSSMELTFKYI